MQPRKQSNTKTITKITEYVEGLPEKDKEITRALFEFIPLTGKLTLPKEMYPWVKKTFGSPESVEKQRIMRIRNKLTEDTALFNSVRSNRPMESTGNIDVEEVVRTARDPFSNPEPNTPLDEQGRIQGTYVTTSANVAKYDGDHSLIIFNEPNPYKVSEPAFIEAIQTAFTWFDKVGEGYPFLMWNCLWKSGASVVHTHMQMTMAHRKPYAYMRKIRKANTMCIESYEKPYFKAWRQAHDSLGLSYKTEYGEIVSSITPVKERELVCFPKDITPETIGSMIYSVKEAYLEAGVQSFNMGLYIPKSSSIPLHFRFVDRGKLDTKTTDFGGVEVLAEEKIVGNDPYNVLMSIKEAL